MRLTASKVALASHCTYSFRDDAPQDPYRSSDAADRGNRFHSAIAEFLETGELKSYEDDIAAEMAEAISWMHAKGWARRDLEIESAFGWDAATDDAKRYQIEHRGYPKDGLLHGTADLIVWEDGKATVLDWKTGDGSGAGPQLRALGLMVARYCALEEVTVAALEVKASGVTEVCRETLDSFALSALAGELADAVASIPTAEPTPGSHCGELYCNSRLGCPAGNAATAELVDVIPADALTRAKPFKLTDPIRTPEHAAWALDVLRLVSAKVDAIKDDIKARVPPEGWALEDGRMLRETKSSVSYPDKDQLQSLARRLGATDQDIESCMRSFDRSNGLRVVGGEKKPRTRKTKAA